MRFAQMLLATALLGLGVTACGGGGSIPNGSSNAAAAKGGASTAASTIIPDTPATRGYLNDGDHDQIGDADSDNSKDNDKDRSLDYKPDDNRNYHDSDDLAIVDYGNAASAAEEQAVAAVVERYYATAAKGDGAAACVQLAPTLVKLIPTVYGQFGARYLRGAKTCSAVMTRQFEHSRAQLSHPVRVTSVRIEGTRALALLGSRTLPASYIVLAGEGGAWRVNSLIGVPLR